MKQLLIALIVVLLHIALETTAQNSGINYHPKSSHNPVINYFPDSIRLEFPEHHAIVVFELKRFGPDHSFISGFPEILKEHIDYIKRGTNEQEIPKRITVRYKPEGEKEITIEPVDSQTIMTANGNTITQLLPPAWEIFIHTKTVKAYIYAEDFKDIENLANQDLDLAISQLKRDPEIDHIGKKSLRARMIMEDKAIKHSSIHYTYPLDMLSLEAQAGIGLLGNKFFPELNLTTGLFLTDHFRFYSQRIELTYNNMFLAEQKTEGGFTTNINSFLSLSYSRNFNRKNGQPRWTGLGAGYLIRNKGNYFNSNTMKVFLTIDIVSDKLNLIPELYLTDDFKKGLFGIKLNYRFLW